MLAEGGLRQPVVVNEDIEIQNTIVEQAALRIAKGNAPAGLAGRSIIKVDTANLFSNTRSLAEAAQIVDSIVNEAVACKGRIILFVDEMTNFVGSNASSASFFSAIAEGELSIIGGSNATAYEDQISTKPEVAGYFEGILVAGRSNAAIAQNDISTEYRGDNVSPDLLTPIGDEGSEVRRHADMLTRHLVEPAFQEFSIRVVRADRIEKSGLISQQIFEHIVSARFCVADLSFGNPNAFYELGVRHMTKLPTIQIIRKATRSHLM